MKSIHVVYKFQLRYNNAFPDQIRVVIDAIYGVILAQHNKQLFVVRQVFNFDHRWVTFLSKLGKGGMHFLKFGICIFCQTFSNFKGRYAKFIK